MKPELNIPPLATVPAAPAPQLQTQQPAVEIAPRAAASLAEFGPRLVTLCDGRPGLRGGLHAEVREPSAAESPASNATPAAAQGHAPAVLDFIASSEALDRFGEIICASGWRLENYRRNPVFQNAHQYSDVIFTLGKALITEVHQLSPREAPDSPSTLNHQPSASLLYQRIEFAVDVNPMARIAYGLYRGKFLNAVSVGFIPLRWENGKSPSRAAAADGSPGFRRRYLEQELLEVSAVGIPANPEALQLGLRAGAIERADLRDLLDLLRSLVPEPSTLNQQPSTNNQPTTNPQSFQAVPDANASAPGVRNDGAQWLQLAGALRDILRRT